MTSISSRLAVVEPSREAVTAGRIQGRCFVEAKFTAWREMWVVLNACAHKSREVAVVGELGLVGWDRKVSGPGECCTPASMTELGKGSRIRRSRGDERRRSADVFRWSLQSRRIQIAARSDAQKQ